jgi:hypothetical protein
VHDLDRHLAALGRAEIDHDLNALESAVWGRIDAQSRRSLRPMPTGVAASICALMALLASIAGVATAAAARTMPEPTAFTVEAPLAPSTALGG